MADTERPVMERLIAARDLIAQRGLGRHKFYKVREKCYCTVGSIIAAEEPDSPHKFMGKFGQLAADDPLVNKCCAILMEVVRTGREWGGMAPEQYLYRWSDDNTVDDVLLAFDKAIEIARVRNV